MTHIPRKRKTICILSTFRKRKRARVNIKHEAMNSQNPVNWKLINEQIESALSSYDKVMLHIRLSADFGYTNSIFFDSSKKQEILHALVPFNSKNHSIEEVCLLAINSDKAIIKSYTNAKILEVIEIHQMGEKGYSKGVIHNFRTVNLP